MSGRSVRGAGAGLAIAAAGLIAAIGLQLVRDRQYPGSMAPEREILYVRSPAAMDRMALSYDAVLADVYWVRAVQHFGGQRLKAEGERSYELLYPLLDITTTLDPYFNIAYRFGAIFLAEGYPDGPARPDLAVKLLQKGLRAQPQKWQYLYDTAFVYYWWIRDYKKASYWFQEASRIPGSPEWLDGLAAITLSQGHDRQGARFLWRQIYDAAEQSYMRKTAQHRLEQLDAMDQIDQLNTILERAAGDGEPVRSWDALVARGWLRRAPPRDPAGVPYVIGADGRATVSEASPYFPLPTEQAPGPAPASRPPA